MENSSEIASFLLAAYGNIGELKYLYFSIIMLWYLSICAANTLLIVVIHIDRRLHEPMYILICILCLNEIKVSTSLYPFLLSQMFSDSHEVTLPWCFLQMCCIYTIHSNISEIFAIVSIFIPFSLISVSYMKILAVCRKTSKENRQKAVTACTPQIISVSNLFVGCIFSFTDFMFLVRKGPDEVHVILPMYLLICQPVLTPFIYGFNLPKIRQSFERFLSKRK